jgi:Flp pilus assembly protein TadD
LGDYEEALQVLFRLNYEDADDTAVLRALAWTLLCSDKIEQACNRYAGLTSKEGATSEDFLNQGYSQWIAHNIKEAVESFKKSIQLSGNNSEDFWLTEYDLLTSHGISNIDIALMRAMVLS